MAGKRKISMAEEFVRQPNYVVTGLRQGSMIGCKMFVNALLRATVRDGTAASASAENKELYHRLLVQSNVDFSTGFVAEIPISEMIRNWGLSDSGKNYEAIMSTAMFELVNQWNILTKFDGVISAYSLIVGATADRQSGKVYVKFSSEERIQESLVNMRNNYTTYNVSLLYKFRNEYAYTFYLLIKSRIDYYESNHAPLESYDFTYGLSEIKYKLGVLNPQKNKRVYNILSQDKPDYELAEQTSRETKYAVFGQFKRVLSKICTEINALTEYSATVVPIRSGRGGKTTAVTFTITRKSVIPTVAAQEENKSSAAPLPEEFDPAALVSFILHIHSILPDINENDCLALAHASGLDFDKLKHAYDIAKNCGNIRNMTGFLIRAMEKGYQASPYAKKTTGAVMKGNSFNNFPQRSYSEEELELLAATTRPGGI